MYSTKASSAVFTFLPVLLLVMSADSSAKPSAAKLPASCAELTVQNRAQLKAFLHARAKVRREFTGARPLDKSLSSYDELLSRCVATPDGYVALAVRKIEGCAGDCNDVTWRLRVRMALVHVAGAKQVSVNKLGPRFSKDQDLDIGFEVEEAPQSDSLVDLLGAFDYDGDGAPEVLIASSVYDSEDGGKKERKLMSLTSRGLWPYGKSPPLSSDSSMRDVDHDGRPDLLTRGPYEEEYIDSCGLGADPHAITSMFVEHSLPDGSFSGRDAAALAALKQACPSSLPLAVAKLHKGTGNTTDSLDRDLALARAVVCARAYAAPEVIFAQVATDCQRWVEGSWYEDKIGCGEQIEDARACPMWLQELIKVKTRLRLTSTVQP